MTKIFKRTLWAVMLLAGMLSARAQQVTLSPVPQKVEWGAKAFDRASATFRLTGKADEATLGLLDKHFGPQKRGSVQIIVGTRGDKAVKRWADRIPEQAEGYFLAVEKDRIVVAGRDRAGTYYGVQTLVQLMGQPEVMAVTVADWPMTAKRGVIEGFYGNPWSFDDRKSQFEFYGANKLNIYVYGPKDDVYHHSRWYEPYPEAEAQRMRELVRCAADNKVKFVWAMHPSNSIVSEADRQKALAKFEQMYGLGVRAFAIFFDDISAKSVNDQVAYLNFLTDEFVDKKADVEPMIVCPTQYNKGWSGGDYLSIMGTKLYPDIEIMWTGNSVCDMIQKDDTDWIHGQTGRKPFIWLNYPVNDYGQHNLLMGPLVDNGTDIYDQVSAFCSNPMQYAEASKVVLYSIADYTWNPAAFEPFSAWERAIASLMPEHKEAFGIFCKSNVDVAPNTHGMRVYDETPEFKALAEKYKLADGKEAVAAYAAYFTKTRAAAGELLSLAGRSAMVDEIKEFVQCFDYQALRGLKVTEMAAALDANRPEDFIAAYKAYRAATDAAGRLVSRDFPGSIQSVVPHTATLHVEPFLKNASRELVAAFKKSGAAYPEGLFPEVVLENGTYFIKVDGKFLTNVAGSQTPTLQAEADNINEGRQRWIITLEGSVDRYSIKNEWDKRYVNEIGNFGRNNYSEEWNTYLLTRHGGKFAVQNAGNGGSAFWTSDGTRLMPGARNGYSEENFIFEIIPVNAE